MNLVVYILIFCCRFYRFLGRDGEPVEVDFVVPLPRPVPPQYILRVVSDYWMGSNQEEVVTFKHLIVPEEYPSKTGNYDFFHFTLDFSADFFNFVWDFSAKFSIFLEDRENFWGVMCVL